MPTVIINGRPYSSGRDNLVNVNGRPARGRTKVLVNGRVRGGSQLSSTARQAQQIRQRETLLKVGYRVSEDPQHIALAWKNYQAAQRRGLDVQHAADYWNRNSGIATPKNVSIDINGPHRGSGVATATPNKPLSNKPTFTVSPPPKAKPVANAKGRPSGGGAQQLSPYGAGFDPASLLGPGGNGDIYNGNLVPLSLAQTGRLDPSSADAIAGAQYDQAIADLQRQQHQQPRQAAQDLADITNWYAQVMGAQTNAANQDAAMSAAAVPSLSNADAAIVASLGGSANQGAGTVAQQQTNDVGTLQALGNNEAQYNSDVMPILQLAKAGAMSNEQAKQMALAAQIAGSIQDQMHARGQAQAAALADIQKFNIGEADTQRQQALGIRQYNNQLRQQGFSNKLALQNAAIASMLSGARAQYYAQGGSRGSKSRQPQLGTFARMSPSQKASLASRILNSLPDPKQTPLTPAQARQQITAAVRNAGINPALHQPWINSIYSTYQSYLPQQG